MLKNKVVFVTGAGGGIGKNIAIEYARKGAKVIATDIKGEFSFKNISFYKMDLRDENSIKEVFFKVKKNFRTIHILINNGAISRFNKDIYNITIDEFDNVINTNLRGAFICSKEFIKANEGESFGRIINIASTRWNQNESGWEAYGASKGGIVSLTNTMAVSLSEKPITVNAISPGWIETEDYNELTEKDHKQHPSGRVGKPEDISRICLFLSEEENDFINGANIVVDGGMTKKMIYE